VRSIEPSGDSEGCPESLRAARFVVRRRVACGLGFELAPR